ncbi:hypothetical protein GCM10011360_42390 [Primorskyibacter flagellatus]|uniref:Antitoxin CcdA n=1 Tax=Primorskyibacter flagellatus TaxID=1387277 RepID=A0A917AGF2_9RHOB|nr:type II toxin-antitoxin system CcdA family antitoxin [Primorskyibacter flagellatus]GGE50896.1 hypothetical protein GCM10011360_42390 [Primorskyibacter flagellatus]
MAKTPRKSTSMSLDADLLAEARALGVNISRAAEKGLEEAVKRERTLAWQKEHAGAIQEFNDWIEKNGVPFAEFRKF